MRIIAGVALAVDIATAVLTYTMSRGSLNVKAAFVHNVSDALASVGVIVAGTLILLYEWYWVDPVVTLAIAAYILWQGGSMTQHHSHPYGQCARRRRPGRTGRRDAGRGAGGG